MKPMVFELWRLMENEPERLYQVPQDKIHSCYYDMKIGEQRHISGRIFLVRVA
jgi:hypothetical protein